RSQHLSYYDPKLDHLVIALGIGATAPDMWGQDESDPQSSPWIQIASSPGPSKRDMVSLAYDEYRGRVVLFGGATPSNTQFDTWELVDDTWDLRTPNPHPSARASAGMAYDSDRRRMVLYGGDSSDLAVWEWDGTAWSPHTPGGPAPRGLDATVLAYD